MQTETQSGPLPLQEFPAHLIGIAQDTVGQHSANTRLAATQASHVEKGPDLLGAFRGAIYCLPIAMVMWAIIIAAVVHFLIA